MAASPMFTGTIKTVTTRILPATGTSLVTVLTAPTGGALIESLFLASTESVARDVSLYLNMGGADILLDTWSIPAVTASIKVQKVNLLDPSRWGWLDPNNVRMLLEAGAMLKVASAETLTLNTQIGVFCLYGMF